MVKIREIPSHYSLIISAVALMVSGFSFWLSYQTYREQTITSFAVEALPSYYEPLKFSYFPAGPLPDAIHLDAVRPDIDEQGRAIVPAHPSPEPKLASATIMFPIEIMVTNLSKRSIPLKKVFYFVLDSQDKKSSAFRRLAVSEDSHKDSTPLHINIGPGETQVVHGKIQLQYEGEIADQLSSIFMKNTAKTVPSLARLNLYAIANGERLKGGSPFPHLSQSYIGSASLLVGVEDYTGNESMSDNVKISFPLPEFMGFIIAEHGETSPVALNPGLRSQSRIEESDRASVVVEKERLLKGFEFLVLAREKGCC